MRGNEREIGPIGTFVVDQRESAVKRRVGRRYLVQLIKKAALILSVIHFLHNCPHPVSERFHQPLCLRHYTSERLRF